MPNGGWEKVVYLRMVVKRAWRLANGEVGLLLDTETTLTWGSLKTIISRF